jgi:hypothetical protein
LLHSGKHRKLALIWVQFALAAIPRIALQNIFAQAGSIQRLGNACFEFRRIWMNRPILAFASLMLAATALVAQDASQSNPYQGTSNPPQEDITTSEQQQPIAKPSPAHPMSPETQAAPAQPQQSAARPSNAPVPMAYGDGTDDGIVGVAPSSNPTLTVRGASADPDSDIVHPAPLPPGVLGEGTLIRVQLTTELSSALSQVGQPFRSRVATDVLQDGNVIIPAGAEISGRVAQVSSGHFAGKGSILLAPDTVTLANGNKFQLRAVVVSTPGTNAKVGSEGIITPGSRLKRNSLMYGSVAGGGMIVGAIVGGPPGMLVGGLIGAGIVTTHLLVSHPQANLESGSYLMLTVTQQVQLVPALSQGN